MKRLLQSAIIAALAIPAPASAQLLDPAGRPLDGSRRVSLGLSVPLGGPKDAPAKPQLELRATAGDRRESTTLRDADRRYLGGREQRAPEARIGFTLEAYPQLTVAGQEIPPSDERRGISTLGVVAIGIGVAAVVGGVLLLDRINAASD